VAGFLAALAGVLVEAKFSRHDETQRISGRPLLSSECVPDSAATLAETPRRHSGAGGTLCRDLFSPDVQANRTHRSGNNVRTHLPPVAGEHSELQNFIERSVILTSGNILHPPLASLKNGVEAESLGAITLEDAERDHIRKTLDQTRWVVAGPKGGGRTFGNQEIYALLPDAKAWHLTYQQGSRSGLVDRPSNRLTPFLHCPSAAPAIESPVNLNPKLFDTQSNK
jgi:hypothetical protein